MKFRTIVKAKDYHTQISYLDSIFCFGSCFTGHIGKKLDYVRFNVMYNPFGVIYNPFSLRKSFKLIIDNHTVERTELFHKDQLFGHWDFPGQFYHTDPLTCQKKLNDSISDAHKFLKSSKVIFITLGTAFVYHLKETGEVVANCHKYPSKNFIKRLLDHSQVNAQLDEMINQIKSFNSEASIFFTISPVRHIRDGVIENQRSKAILLSALHNVIEKHKSTHYFPSYELLIDDLRDYRYYSKDLCHINEQGIQYVWEYFKSCFLGKETLHLLGKIEAIQKDLSHRVMHPDRDLHRLFKTSVKLKISDLETHYPYIKFNLEGDWL